MKTKHAHNGVTWIDLESPTRDEVISLMNKYDLHPLVAEELVTPSIRPKVDLYKNSIYLILHFPSLRDNDDAGGIDNEQEIDFVIGKNFIITAHYKPIDSLLNFGKMFEATKVLDKHDHKGNGQHAGFLFYHMIRDLYHQLGLELDDLTFEIREIEDSIYHGDEAQMVKEISRINRRLLNFKQAIRFHRQVLESFEQAGQDFFGHEFSYYLKSVTSEYYKVYDLLLGHKEIVEELRDTNDSLLTNKTNAVIKILTIMAFTTIPVTLATQILSMNTEVSFLQAVDNSAFYLILGLAGFVSLIMFAIFKKKHWF